MRVRLLTFITILLILTGSGYAYQRVADQDVPTRDAMIKLLSEASKQLRSFSANLSQKKYFYLFNEEETSTGKIFYQSPDKLIVNIEKPKPQILGTDGTKGWLYLPDIKQVQRMSIDNIKKRGTSFVKFLINPSQYFRENKITFLDRFYNWDTKEEIYNIQIEPNQPMGQDQDFFKLVLWIRKSKPLPVMKLELTEASKDKITYELSNIQTNLEIPASTFQSSFPADAEIVDY